MDLCGNKLNYNRADSENIYIVQTVFSSYVSCHSCLLMEVLTCYRIDWRYLLGISILVGFLEVDRGFVLKWQDYEVANFFNTS